MIALSTLDYVLIFSFFAITLIVGFWVSKKSGKSSSEYFLSGRTMPWWLLGVSMVATTFSTDTPNLVTDFVRSDGVAGNWSWWAFSNSFTGFVVFDHLVGWTLAGFVLAPRPVHVFVAGDSTAAEKRADRRPETGWAEHLQSYFDTDDVRVVNLARNGRSTRTFIEEGRWASLLDEVRPGDYVVIQFGHNDQSESKPDRYTPPDAFQANLRRFVADVRQREATPVLMTPVVRRRFDEAGQFYDVHGPYPDLTRAVADETGAPLVDMHRASEATLRAWGAEGSKDLFLILAPGESPNYPDGLDDNTHVSPLGASVNYTPS